MNADHVLKHGAAHLESARCTGPAPAPSAADQIPTCRGPLAIAVWAGDSNFNTIGGFAVTLVPRCRGGLDRLHVSSRPHPVVQSRVRRPTRRQHGNRRLPASARACSVEDHLGLLCTKVIAKQPMALKFESPAQTALTSGPRQVVI